MEGNTSILVLVDHFTRWCNAIPILDKQAKTVAHVLNDLVLVFFVCQKPFTYIKGCRSSYSRFKNVAYCGLPESQDCSLLSAKQFCG